ncbi:hypothetical protein F5Y03DRAFT_409723 [Xylaria venustula]|nr:hypothetical protein F5Y03DRAFT_409723 [Xylaria venustula]
MYSRPRTNSPHFHHRHHHHSPRRSSSPGNRRGIPKEDSQRDMLLAKGRMKIYLFDIDTPITGRPRVVIGARETSTLENVASFLKDKFDRDVERVAPDDRIEFFYEQVPVQGKDIPKGCTILWYRVITPRDDGLFKVKWKKSFLSVDPYQYQLGILALEIRAGATVGQLRHRVARFLQEKYDTIVINSDQVVIWADGGFRPGPVQGDDWQCKNIEGWACRHLTMSIVPPKEFHVFCGLNERYVLHKPNMCLDGTSNGLLLKTNFKFALLHTICQKGRRLDTVGTDDISLYCHQRLVKDRARFRPGMVFEFELSHKAESAFVEAEAWLLPLAQTCTICAEKKRVSDMPARGRITEDCEHKASVCKECIKNWITYSMETTTWDQLSCPECPTLLSHREVEKYDKLATKEALEQIEGFRWCLNPQCDAGQIFPLHCEKAECYACKHSACIHHDIPWHRGETCSEYDQRTRKQRQSERLSEKYIKETAKPCPRCKKSINKYFGCDHMTCVCGHEWCWLCSAEYTRDSDSFLQCNHTRECRYYKAPPFWEGRRAIEQALDPGGGQARGIEDFFPPVFPQRFFGGRPLRDVFPINPWPPINEAQRAEIRRFQGLLARGVG